MARRTRTRADSPSTWRDEIVIPYLQRQFEALEVHEDGRLFGVLRDTQEQIDQGFYDPELLASVCLQNVLDKDGDSH